MSEFNKDAQRKVYRQAASKIDDKMRAVRSNRSRFERSWIWELIQNAKDKAGIDFKEEKVNIYIELNNNELLFKHNFGYFTSDNIEGLISQDSSEDKEKDRIEHLENDEINTNPSIGRFGTGFMTTHLLSEVVTVKGLYKKEIGFQSIEFDLDRRPTDKHGFIDSIEASFNQAEKAVERVDNINQEPDFREYNTSFSYKLENEKNTYIAQKGLEDLSISLPYTLVFVEGIEKVEIIEHSKHIIYAQTSKHLLSEDHKIYCVKISKTTENQTEIFHYITIDNGNTAIAIEVTIEEGQYKIKEQNRRLPHIFLNYPLIGTENFTIPMIINNPYFEPTEARDGVLLSTDDITDKNTINNQAIILQSFQLLAILIDFSIENEWANLYNWLKISTPKSLEGVSKSWFKKEIKQPYHQKILTLPLVTNHSGAKKSVSDIWFPCSENHEIRNKIWQLAIKWIPDVLPSENETHHWYSELWSDCNKLTIEEIAEDIQKTKNISGIITMLDSNENEAVKWLNEFYDILNFENSINKDSSFIKNVIDNKFSLIPNQHQDFKKRSDLYIDDNIDENFKNVLSILGNDIRGELRLNTIITASKYQEENEGQISYTSRNQSYCVKAINEIIKERKHNKIKEACNYLSSLIVENHLTTQLQQSIFNFCASLQDLPSLQFLSNYEDDMYEEVNKYQIRQIVISIAQSKNITNLEKSNSNHSIQWLNSFIELLTKEFKNELELKTNSCWILPNQNGVFCDKSELFLEETIIDEQLKDILVELNYPIRKELLHKDICLDFPDNQKKNQKDVANLIIEKIRPGLNESPRSSKFKEIAKNLFLWINKNDSVAKDLFPDLYTHKHKLREDEDIVKDIEEVEATRKIFEEYGITSLIELKDRLKNKEQSNEKEKLKPEILENQLQQSTDATLSSEFSTDISINDQQEANRVAKEIVKQKLESEGFDFTNSIDDLSTIDGVIKDNVEYPLVVKSYIYQEAPLKIGANEWIQLMKPNSMFWVHFGNRKLDCLKLLELLKKQDKISISFNIENLEIENRLDKFAELLRHFENVHFDFNSVKPSDYSIAKDLNDYCFDVRKKEGDVSGDDEKYL